MRASARPAQYSRLVLAFIGAGLLSVVCALDVFTGAAPGYAFFYLVPIYFASWYLPFAFAMAFSVAVYIAMGAAAVHFQPGAAMALLTSPTYLVALAFFLASAFLLSRLGEAYRVERQLSSHDYLTGVFNRREFFHLVEVERLRAIRYARAMTLVFLDLDNFKATNDRYGHAAGDEILALVARTLRDSVRGTDLVARLGGDEFVVLLEETDAESARTIVGKLREALHDSLSRSTSPITVSMGVVTFVIPPASVDEMVNLGDSMMYMAKHQGGDRAIFRTSEGTLPQDSHAAGA